MRIRTGHVIGPLLALLLPLVAAGCGAAAGDGVATAGGPNGNPTSTAGSDGLTGQERNLRFAQCMRDNGVPNFPDPELDDSGRIQLQLPEGADRQKVDAAMELCRQHLPNGGEPPKADAQVMEQQRKFAKCMRDNGVPNFPDPDENGGIRIDGNSSGMNRQDPSFQTAEKACALHRPAGPSGEPGVRETRSSG